MNIRKFKDYVGDCPSSVHNKVVNTLNNLPNRRRIMRTHRWSVPAAAVLVLLVSFGAVWTINPALAQGNSFRDAVANFFGFNPSVHQLIEPPLPAQDISVLPESATPGEKAALTAPNEEGNQVPTVSIDDYIFELEDKILYDGETLTVGYNVRRADGAPMPPVKEYTKAHMAGFIRIFDLVIDNEVIRDVGPSQFDWDDPYVYRQICSYYLKDYKKPITSESQLMLKVAVHDYGEHDNVTTFAELPFSVDTSHENAADTMLPIETVFTRGDFTVELLPIKHSALSTQIIIRAYKEGDPEFGRHMDGHLSIVVRDMQGKLLPCPPNSELSSMGHHEDEKGSTYMEYTWFVDPTFELPNRFQLTFGRGESGDGVSYEPIMIELS